VGPMTVSGYPIRIYRCEYCRWRVTIEKSGRNSEPSNPAHQNSPFVNIRFIRAKIHPAFSKCNPNMAKPPMGPCLSLYRHWHDFTSTEEPVPSLRAQLVSLAAHCLLVQLPRVEMIVSIVPKSPNFLNFAKRSSKNEYSSGFVIDRSPIFVS
jgi:hypothetical protein